MSQDGREERFRLLQQRYLGTAGEEIAELERLFAAAGDASPAGEDGERFKRLAHNLRGSGGSYRFGSISDAAGELEDAWAEGGDADALRAALEQLRAALQDARKTIGDVA